MKVLSASGSIQKARLMATEIYGHLAVLKLGQILGFDCTVNDAAKRVFLMIAGYSGTDGTAFPSINRISKEICMSRTAVTKQVSILEKHGYLTRETRFHPTGGRTSNIIAFNIDMARKFHDTPTIFCKAHVTAVVTCIATLLHYGGLEPVELMSLETFGGCTKKTVQEIIIEKNKKKKKAEAIKKANVKACAWEAEKELEAATGVGKEEKKRLSSLSNKLRNTLGGHRLVEFDIKAQQSVKGMKPLEAINQLIKIYEQEIQKHGADQIDENQC